MKSPPPFAVEIGLAWGMIQWPVKSEGEFGVGARFGKCSRLDPALCFLEPATSLALASSSEKRCGGFSTGCVYVLNEYRMCKRFAEGQACETC